MNTNGTTSIHLSDKWDNPCLDRIHTYLHVVENIEDHMKKIVALAKEKNIRIVKNTRDFIELEVSRIYIVRFDDGPEKIKDKSFRASFFENRKIFESTNEELRKQISVIVGNPEVIGT